MQPLPATPQQAIVGAWTHRSKRRYSLTGIKEGGIFTFSFLCAFLSVFTTFAIIWILFSQSVPFFQKVSFSEFFTGTKWEPAGATPKYGIWPLLSGTLQITVGSALIAIPLGLLSAIFLSEYAPPKLRNLLKPALEILAGIPTVVYGYFALFFVTPLLKHVIPSLQPTNALAGSIVVAVMILPLVSSLCEDAISSVPQGLREGAYGLGATKLEVITKIVVPAALSGIMASFILAISRAVGETMAVTLAAGATPNLSWNPSESIMTMTAYIVNVTKGDIPQGSVQYYTIFAVGSTLFVMTMLLNLLAVRLVKKYRRVYA